MKVGDMVEVVKDDVTDLLGSKGEIVEAYTNLKPIEYIVRLVPLSGGKPGVYSFSTDELRLLYTVTTDERMARLSEAKRVAAAKDAEIARLSDRLKRIAEIIWDVDGRCMAADGPVTNTRDEMTDDELREIWYLVRDVT